ncbi:MAG: ArsR/SmtB family transcription factor [Acidobacteriota bacterium]
MKALAHSLQILADPTRLRLLRLLSEETLTVGELTAILGMAQPSVSKQLATLRRAGLIRLERHGAFAYYRVGDANGTLWTAVSGEMRGRDDPDGDLARLSETLRRRAERGGGPRPLEPGRSWPAWARALGWLIPPLRVADLGCGDGALTAEIARWARRVIAIDRDRARLLAARRRLRRQGFKNVRFLCEPIEEVSLAARSVDVVVLSQTLHDIPEPARTLHQAHRILVAGGRLLLLDLAFHQEKWVRKKLGHLHLGFRPDALAHQIHAAGFTRVSTSELPRGPGQPFQVLLATGTRSRRRAKPVRRPGR